VAGTNRQLNHYRRVRPLANPLFGERLHTRQEMKQMATPQERETPTDLPAQNARSVADALNGILADSYALYLKTKNFHWHVSGPHFRDYHLLFDEQAAEILLTTDAIADRVRKTGNTTLRSIGDIARRQTIRDNDAEFVAAKDMLIELREDNLSLVQSLREAKDVVDEAKDNATSGVIDEWTDAAEKRSWFLFEAAQPG
jgi:starvation-inducible DNA-binding protein